jgi:hypothetical protein
MTAPKDFAPPDLTGFDAGDQLELALTLAARKIGVRIDAGRLKGKGALWTRIRDLREDLQALEGRLARIEAQAKAEHEAERPMLVVDIRRTA